MATLADVSNTVAQALASFKFSIKPKQLQALLNVLNGVDTLCVFPTSYGKSLIYQLLPFVCTRLRVAASSSPLVLVVSPLISLIEDQVASANSLSALGLKASKLDMDCYEKICCGEYNILFGTPESWLDNLKWREFLSSKYVVDNVVCLVVDEVHKVTWGVAANRIDEPFREAFGRISEMRSICRQNLPVLALSATVDVDLTQLIVSSCDLSKDLNIISTCSDRKNIRLTIIDIRDRENVESLRWVINMLVRGLDAPKVILYCRSVSLCGFIFYHVRKMLEKETLPAGVSSCDLIGLYHSQTLESNKAKVLSSLTSDSGNIRFVVATSSLGCGVNTKNVRYVIHYGAAYDTTDYCQQIGRAGRNVEELCHAILYTFSQGQRRISKSMMAYIRNETQGCLRTALFTPFNEDVNTIMPLSPGHNCCSFCNKKCDCEGSCPLLPFEFLPTNNATAVLDRNPIRKVDEHQKQLVKDMLIEYHETVCSKPMLLVPSEVVTGLSKHVIDEIVMHLPYIDSLQYCHDHLQLNKKDTCKELIFILNDVFGDIDVVSDKGVVESMDTAEVTNLKSPVFSDFSDAENDSDIEV